METKDKYKESIVEMLKRITNRSDSIIKYESILDDGKDVIYKYSVQIGNQPVFDITHQLDVVFPWTYKIEIKSGEAYNTLEFPDNPKYVFELITLLRDLFEEREGKNALKSEENTLNFLKQFDKNI